MTSISSTLKIADIIRSQITHLKNAKSSRVSHSKKNDNKHQASNRGENPPDIAEVITTRIRQIDELDPDRVTKAFRIFLESILVAELGSQLLNDPRFFQMIDSIQMQMESDAKLSEMIRSAMESILDSK